jgi:hypothetical protein
MSTIRLFTLLFVVFTSICYTNVNIFPPSAWTFHPPSSHLTSSLNLNPQTQQSCLLKPMKLPSWACAPRSLVSLVLYWEETPLIQLDNFRFLKNDTNNLVLTTACNDKGWTAVILDKTSGHPIYSTLGGDSTIVAALINMFEHTSELISDHFEDLQERLIHVGTSSTGIEYSSVSIQID